MNASIMSEERREIVFFDVETTIPWKKGQGYSLLEFGAILVCPQRLLELSSYSTLIKPADLSSVSSNHFRRSNGINRDSIFSAPSFGEVADVVYYFLHGRVWAGHNILNFDCVLIHEAFAEIGRPAPEPKGTIDTLTLLTKKFGRRAGNMKMEHLANYFGLGKQTHRSLDDVRMNLEVVKYCSAVLFLESSQSNILTTNTDAIRVRGSKEAAKGEDRGKNKRPHQSTESQNGNAKSNGVVGHSDKPSGGRNDKRIRVDGNPGGQKGLITCFRCGQKGHVATGCDKPKVTVCFSCGEIGHTKGSCGYGL